MASGGGGVIYIFLLFELAAHCFAQEILRGPESVTVFLGQSAVFTCETDGGFPGWVINGSLVEDLTEEIRRDINTTKMTTDNRTTVMELTIFARAEYNGTEVTCKIAFSTGSFANNATLTIEDGPDVNGSTDNSMTTVFISPTATVVSPLTSTFVSAPSTQPPTEPDSPVVAIFVVVGVSVIAILITVVFVVVMWLLVRNKRTKSYGIKVKGVKLKQDGTEEEFVPMEEQAVANFRIKFSGVPTEESAMAMLGGLTDHYEGIADAMDIDKSSIDSTDKTDKGYLQACLRQWLSSSSTAPTWKSLCDVLRNIQVDTIELKPENLRSHLSG